MDNTTLYDDKLQPGEHGYGWSKQKMAMYDLACMLNGARLHAELIKEKPEDPRHLQILTESLDAALNILKNLGDEA
jgi:hypothetical protein